jgi:dTDP-4-amino-4,6-dideoxygalactose transaminase
MSELHAAVALASLADVDAHVDRRHELVARFERAVADVPGLRVVHPSPGDRSTYKDLTLVLDADFGVSAAELQRALAADGIDSRRYYAPPIHRQAAYAGRWENRRDLPMTDRLADSVLSPPLWSHLPDAAMDAMAMAIVRLHHHAPAVAEALRAAAT